MAPKIGTHIYLDIETIPLPEERRAFAKPTEDTIKFGNTKDPVKRADKIKQVTDEWEGTCALSAHLGQIALIGVAIDDGDPYVLGPNDDQTWDEPSIIEAFGDLVSQYHSTHMDRLIGHNINKFDLPFIFRRAMILGISMGDTFTGEMILSLYKRTFFVDTMELWACGEGGVYISLLNLCGAFGIQAKTSPIKSAGFYKHWEKDRQGCIDKCLDDVADTRSVAQQMGY